jgi:hypothetical protein
MTWTQRIAAGSFFFSMFLALWGAIYPKPYALCIGILLVTPLVAILAIALSKGRLAVVGDGKQGLLFFVFLYTMGALAYRAYLDVEIFAKAKALLYALIVAAVMELLLLAVDRAFRSIWILAFLLPVITFTYGIGVILECDMLLDQSRPQRYVTRVLHRDIHWGSRHTTYDVTLAPFGGLTESVTNRVTRHSYYSLSPGTDACVFMAPGALQIPWYKMEPC